MNILFSRNLAIVLGIITPLWKRSGDGIRGRKIRFRFLTIMFWADCFFSGLGGSKEMPATGRNF